MMHARACRRDVSGVLLLDKPRGMTSNQVLQSVKRLFRARKAGHTGSLDPLATGLLPVCFGQATKLSAFLLDANKHYLARCKLGQRTTTADADGEIVEEQQTWSVTDDQVVDSLRELTGEIEQVPPMYSAVKHNGIRLYELARRGIEVERASRRVCIYQLALVRRDNDQLDLDIKCSKGTYVRALVDELGQRLGCGAHVSALRRVAVGPYQSHAMTTLPQLERLAKRDAGAMDQLLLPTDTVLAEWPAVTIDPDRCGLLRMGQAVRVSHAPERGPVRLYDTSEAFIGMGRILEDGRVAPKRLFLVG